jgi:hypothetical protein
MLYRATTRTLLTAAVITTLTLAAATPAAAFPVPRACGGNGGVIGDVTRDGAVTYEDYGDCGTVSVRAKYSHIGGASWTSWKSGQYGVSILMKNAYQGHHRTSRPVIDFYSTR